MTTETIVYKWVKASIEWRSVLNEHRELMAPKINWSAVGAVSIGEARDFANRILKMCDVVEKVSHEN